MIVIGLDQGTVCPAVALLNAAQRKPTLIHHANANLRTFGAPATRGTRAGKQARVEESMRFLVEQLRKALTEFGATHAAIEDPRTAITGLRRAGITNHDATNLQLELFHRLTQSARDMGYTVAHVEPRAVIAHLGLRLPPAAKGSTKAQREKHQKDRRAAKKMQTANFVKRVLGIDGLTEDEFDAVSARAVVPSRGMPNRIVAAPAATDVARPLCQRLR